MRTLIALAVLMPGAALAATAPRTPEAAWSSTLEAGRARIVAQKPKLAPVSMTVDRSASFDALISEPRLGINVDVSRGGRDSFWINGYLKGSATALNPRSTLEGVSIMGDGINVELRPFGEQSYVLRGVYKDAEGRDGSLEVRVDIEGLPVRDMSVREEGLELEISWNSTGYSITGKADPARYGKRELAILGTAVAAATWDVFGR